jgi:hypothetical protein
MATAKRVEGQQHGGAPTIAQIQDAVAAAVAPIRGDAPSGYKGAPLLGGQSVQDINSGERSVGADSAGGEIFPEVFGGGKQVGVQRRPATKKAKGTSGSGVTGATTVTSTLGGH